MIGGVNLLDKLTFVMLNNMPKPGNLMLFDVLYDGGLHIALFTDSIISESVLPLNSHDTSETPYFKEEQSSPIFFVRPQVSHPYITIGNVRAFFNLVFKCLHNSPQHKILH